MLMNCGIFFDFRHGFGDPALSNALRAHITEVLPKFPSSFAMSLRSSRIIAMSRSAGWEACAKNTLRSAGAW